MDENIQTKCCKKCKKLLPLEKFYLSNRVDKYPDQHLNICKECITADINIYNPQTAFEILQEVDVPFINNRWKELVDKYEEVTILKKQYHTPMFVVGRYLATMRLRGYRDYRWEDTEWFK